jgi:5-methylcytosine-specific restriction endonuclease McrA
VLYKDPQKRRESSTRASKAHRLRDPAYQSRWAKKNKFRAQKAWKARNLDKVRSHTRNRQTKVRGLLIENIDYSIVIDMSDGICGLCGGQLTAPIEIDHIIPLSKDGLHSYDNVQATHAQCNRVKAAQILYEIPYNVMGRR